MNWIKASERLPENWDNVVWRKIGKKKPLVRIPDGIRGDHFTIMGQLDMVDFGRVDLYEWLDESTPSPDPSPLFKWVPADPKKLEPKNYSVLWKGFAGLICWNGIMKEYEWPDQSFVSKSDWSHIQVLVPATPSESISREALRKIMKIDAPTELPKSTLSLKYETESLLKGFSLAIGLAKHFAELGLKDGTPSEPSEAEPLYTKAHMKRCWEEGKLSTRYEFGSEDEYPKGEEPFKTFADFMRQLAKMKTK